MKKCYSYSPLPVIKKAFLVLIISLGAFSVSHGQIYWASLSGSAEATPNNSPGTGMVLVTIDAGANTMRVQASFTGLLGNTTASHIHASTATAGTGAAGVATTLPTFTGFPTGVTSGTYDHTFDMLQASSYNPAYVTNNGGTPAAAFAALRTAINDGKSYLNIHSSMFPGGEIRGFLTACTAINVSIPDAFALPGGVLANTVYPAYAPASSITLQSTVSGGTGPYSYNWSNGSTANSITVSPSVTTSYTLAVWDQNGCPGWATKTVNVVDISGGNNGDKIVLCHNGNSLTIAVASVASHLQHGDWLGSCEPEQRNAGVGDLAIRVLGNPSPDHFDIQVRGGAGSKIQLTVYDNLGRVIETRATLPANQIIRLGSSYRTGIYLVEIVQGDQKRTVKLVKEN